MKRCFPSGKWFDLWFSLLHGFTTFNFAHAVLASIQVPPANKSGTFDVAFGEIEYPTRWRGVFFLREVAWFIFFAPDFTTSLHSSAAISVLEASLILKQALWIIYLASLVGEDCWTQWGRRWIFVLFCDNPIFHSIGSQATEANIPRSCPVLMIFGEPSWHIREGS